MLWTGSGTEWLQIKSHFQKIRCTREGNPSPGPELRGHVEDGSTPGCVHLPETQVIATNHPAIEHSGCSAI